MPVGPTYVAAVQFCAFTFGTSTHALPSPWKVFHVSFVITTLLLHAVLLLAMLRTS
jgi:hypothetical protein